MPFEFYKVLHIFGLLLTFSGLLALIFVRWNETEPKEQVRKFAMITHGVGLVIMLVSGFGMLAKTGLMSSLPTWAYIKMVIWLLVGGAIALAKRSKNAAISYSLIVALVTIAAYTAVYKPGG